MASSTEQSGVELACTSSLKRTLEMYLANYALRPTSSSARAIKLSAKTSAEYASVKDVGAEPAREGACAEEGAAAAARGGEAAGALVVRAPLGSGPSTTAAVSHALQSAPQIGKNLLVGRRAAPKLEQPEWHAPWKLMRVISGHLGWVRCIAIDPTNEWYATGSNDRTIKIWDLASGARAGGRGGRGRAPAGGTRAAARAPASPRR